MKSIFENVDCVSFYVDNLDEGIKYYSSLGLKLLWRASKSCGMGLDNDITEVVLVTEHNPIVDFKVEDVNKALKSIIEAGGVLVYGPFDIDIGKCAVVKDKWNNEYCILDMTNGKYTTDEKCNVTGVKKVD